MEHENRINIHQALETSNVAFDWKLEAGKEVPVNTYGWIILEASNSKTPAVYELLNPAPALLMEEELTSSIKIQQSVWPEANILASADLPNETEQSAFLYKIPV